jgi:RNA polymerase sigma-70 factor (family 1)
VITVSDTDLVLMLREGSRDAYAEIYNRYKWLLYKHALKKTGDRDTANDIVQELFINLWTKREDIAPTVPLSAYLYTGIRNRVINLIEHKLVETKYIDSLLDYANTYVASTDHLARTNQLSAIIEQEIAALPSKMREVFELSRKSHLTHKEIATQLNLSEETVKKQIKNALKILRVRLGLIAYIVFLIKF